VAASHCGVRARERAGARGATGEVGGGRRAVGNGAIFRTDATQPARTSAPGAALRRDGGG
jgi:hypothetical protein